MRKKVQIQTKNKQSDRTRKGISTKSFCSGIKINSIIHYLYIKLAVD